MIPVGAIVAALVIAGRYASQASAKRSGTSPVGPRRPFQGRSLAFVLVWVLVWPLWLALLVGNLVDFNLVAAFFALVLTLVCIPWVLVRFVFIPLGWPRASWLLTHLADWRWGRDRSGGAMIAAVLAAARRPQRPTAMAWVRQRLQRLDLLSGAGVVAAAFLADHDHDPDRARALLNMLQSFDPRVVPKTARDMAIEHHLVELLGQGELAAIAAADVKGSRFGRLARACARRLTGVEQRSQFSDLRLWSWWLLAPRRRNTRALVQAALRASPPVMAAVVTPTTTTTTDPLAHVLALHVATTQQRSPLLSEVQALASAWDGGLKVAALDLAVRARALGVHDVEDVKTGIEETVTAALCDLVSQLDLSAVDVTAQPLLLQTAIERVRSERMDGLETATAALRLRVEEAPDLAPVDELHEVATLRALYLSVERTGADARALAYDACQWILCELAVRLWNVRGEHRLANAIFRLLLDEAVAVGDSRGVTTQTANVKCGP